MYRVRVALVGLLFATPLHASPLRDAFAGYLAASEKGDTALKANDVATAKRAYETARALEPQIPKPWLKLAEIAARDGDKREAIALLKTYADMVKPLDLAAEFPTLKDSPGYAALASQFKHNSAPLCRCQTIWRGRPGDFFIAEGLAKDGNRLFAASVKTRRIVAIENGKQTDFAALPKKLAPFGIHVDRAHHRLLVAAAELQPAARPSGESALLSYDLRTGALQQRIDGPMGALLGDLTLAPDGTLYLSDSRGPLLRLAPNGTALEELTHDFISPQGMAVSADGKTLLVADYSAGLQLFDIATRKLTPVDVPRGLTTVAMDGLAQLADGTFVATQNNIARCASCTSR